MEHGLDSEAMPEIEKGSEELDLAEEVVRSQRYIITYACLYTWSISSSSFRSLHHSVALGMSADNN
jgi:hypothetical protein